KAREMGLEPLSEFILSERPGNLKKAADRYLNEKVKSVQEAVEGAKHIIAEQINEDVQTRESVRRYFKREAEVKAKVIKKKQAEAVKYKDYFEFSESLAKIPSHRLLAVLRAEKEGFLRLKIRPDDERVIDYLQRKYVKQNFESSEELADATEDAYKRLLRSSVETEFRNKAKEKADEDAIAVFTKNLRQLLLEAPLGEKRILALDPGFKSGCKLVCMDKNGNLLHNENIYPHAPQKRTTEAAKKVQNLISAHNIEAIAIGNGTASRETENFVKNYVRLSNELKVFTVSEDGASVYSASKVAREEFPDYDVTVRGAVSIGRRLADPLAELVKIDPKSLGIGQYQHDVDEKLLQSGLDRVVESCVNTVGVELNTASRYLLSYTDGLGDSLADNILQYRKENGGFKSRKELKKVKRLGDKAFEQSAGFLRIRNAKNPLDNTAVHPESYYIVKKMADNYGLSVKELISSKNISEINPKDYVDDKAGLPTVKDILEELKKPGRDPRAQKKAFEFSNKISSIEDIRPGMTLPAIITNVTNFGAFADIGIKQNGLIHISNLADKFVKDPSKHVALHEQVTVEVLSVDLQRKRIQLRKL
ncbi:MAG: helix-hairpin-helix domain-containing protein, partial [Bacteroidota bacterium]|nr:helix-hairpin-helix domain-containing protein [Bacteroidota bacterium]